MERDSAQCCCIQYTVIEISDCNCNDLEIGGFSLQGHPRSKVVVSIDSPWVVSYSISIDSVVVSVTIFEIFDIKDIFPYEQW